MPALVFLQRRAAASLSDVERALMGDIQGRAERYGAGVSVAASVLDEEHLGLNLILSRTSMCPRFQS